MGKVSKALLVLGVLASVSAPVQPLLAATNASSENENSAAENSESTTKTVSGSSVELSSSSSSISTSSSSSNANISSSTKVESSSTSDSTTSSPEDAKQPSTHTTDEVKGEDALKANSLFGPGYYPEDFQKKISFRSGRNPFMRNTISFLGGIKNGLQSGWNKHGVLPSVSAAQAILESGWGQSRLAIDGKNLFGIKGNYNGDYVIMPTQEYVNGCWITINAAFRKYPTWNESVEDHGYFLAVNPRYNNLIGETDYRKVTKYLQQDGYATAPNYSAYLNQLIETYKLTAYDVPHIYNKITSITNVNYGGTISQNKRSDGLFSSGPYNTSAETLKPNASAKSYNGQKVSVSQEAVTSGVTWVRVRLTNGQSYWLDKRGIKAYNYTKIISQKNVNYGGTITQSKRSDGLFSSGPYNTSAATLKPNASAKSYNGQKVAVSQEAVTSGVTWVRVKLTNGQSYWLDKRGIKAYNYTKIISQKNVNYGGTITQSKRSDGLFSSGPYNTSAATLKPNASAKSYNGQKVSVSQEAVTSGVTWVRVKLTNGQSYWLDKRGIKAYNYTKIISQKNVNYGGTITQSKRSDGLFSSGPYNTSAATLKPNASAKSYNGQKVSVSQEAVTSGVTWVRVRLTNGQSYWLDKRGIKAYNYTKIISQKNVNYGGTITQSKRSDGLFSSGPYNTSAATLKPNASAKSYNGQKVAVSQETVTSGVTWVRIKLTNGQSYWLDKRGIKAYNYTKIISQKNVNYGGTITQSKRSDGLFSSGPYNTSAATLKPNASAKSYNGQKVAVSQEAVTSGVTWVRVKLTNGQSYWLDKRGIK